MTFQACKKFAAEIFANDENKKEQVAAATAPFCLIKLS